ncbi:MAG TPA: hypothetical protein VIA18_27025 [Polyangia bacterium]|nr:hypothetical protein [Polyangia bacterium]
MGADKPVVDDVAAVRAELEALRERSHAHLLELAGRVRDTVDRATVALERVQDVAAIPGEIVAVARRHSTALTTLSALTLSVALVGAALGERAQRRRVMKQRRSTVGLVAAALATAGGVLGFALLRRAAALRAAPARARIR